MLKFMVVEVSVIRTAKEFDVSFFIFFFLGEGLVFVVEMLCVLGFAYVYLFKKLAVTVYHLELISFFYLEHNLPT